eukprot:3717253-Rhodomonas_salina.1
MTTTQPHPLSRRQSQPGVVLSHKDHRTPSAIASLACAPLRKIEVLKPKFVFTPCSHKGRPFTHKKCAPLITTRSVKDNEEKCVTSGSGRSHEPIRPLASACAAKPKNLWSSSLV